MGTERLTVQQVGLNYDIAGEGSVLLLIHGWAGSHLHWRNAPRYLPNYRVVAPDLFDFEDDQEFELEDYSQLLRSLLARLGVEHCTVVGHSMGGQIAATLASESQTPVVGLVLVEAPVSYELQNVKCPILLVFGERDEQRIAIASVQRRYSRLADVVFIRRAGHNVMLDQPAAFYKELAEWLWARTAKEEHDTDRILRRYCNGVSVYRG
jgi:pimeloyl-ACP methyl ester carboxylesterase